MFWDNLSQKERVGLLIGVAFMLFAFLDRAVISPINSHIHRIDQQIEDGKKELALELRNISQRPSLSGEYKKYVPNNAGRSSDEERMAQMLSTIEDFGHKAGVVLVDVKPQNPKSSDVPREYTVSVEAESEMIPLVNFLYAISQSSGLLRVESLQLNLKDKNSKILKSSILISKVALP